MTGLEATPECGCIARINAMPDMQATNSVILVSYFGRPRAFVTTCKADEKKRGKPSMLMASYCPFCGIKYQHRIDPDADPDAEVAA